MKLNAGIIFEYLGKTFDAELLGNAGKSLNLPRPIFFMEDEPTFLPDRLYLASADHLPARPSIKDGAAIVCIGDAPQLYRYTGRCSVIHLKGHPDFFEVYLAIQTIYDRFDAWNDRVFELFRSDADLQKVVSLSSEAFERPIILVDNGFRILASSTEDGSEIPRPWSDESGRLSQYSMENYLSSNELHTDVREPMFLKIVDRNALCANLFDKNGVYIGCLSILTTEDEPRAGFSALASYLARIIEASIERNPAVLSTEHAARKGVLKNLIAGRPIGPNQRWLLESVPERRRYICVLLHAFDQEQRLPATFICNSFEMAFPGSYALSIDSGTVGIVELSAFGDNAEGRRETIDASLGTLSKSLKLTAGVSYGFSSLYDVPVYIGQAEAAIDNGSLMAPGGSVYHFSDYALTEMVINSLAGSPVESLVPESLEKVIEHDATSSISYLETLRVFLAENMKFSKVANLLYIHRSTLIDRIEKIEKNYGLDLHDPDTRLYLQLILKALEISEVVKKGL